MESRIGNQDGHQSASDSRSTNHRGRRCAQDKKADLSAVLASSSAKQALTHQAGELRMSDNFKIRSKDAPAIIRGVLSDPIFESFGAYGSYGNIFSILDACLCDES